MMDINSLIKSAPEEIVHYIKSFVFDDRIQVHSKLHEWSWQRLILVYQQSILWLEFRNAVQNTTEFHNALQNSTGIINLNALISSGSRGRSHFFQLPF